MTFFKMARPDKADNLFSRYIRMRDGQCVRCGRRGSGPDKIGGIQCSHFFSRKKESVRFDPDNCDSLCFSCHEIWEHEKMNRNGDLLDYGQWKFKQLGAKRFNLLEIRAATHQKKDRAMSLLYVKQLMTDLKSLDVKTIGAKA